MASQKLLWLLAAVSLTAAACSSASTSTTSSSTPREEFLAASLPVFNVTPYSDFSENERVALGVAACRSLTDLFESMGEFLARRAPDDVLEQWVDSSVSISAWFTGGEEILGDHLAGYADLFDQTAIGVGQAASVSLCPEGGLRAEVERFQTGIVDNPTHSLTSAMASLTRAACRMFPNEENCP